jgi:hypothetical protein
VLGPDRAVAHGPVVMNTGLKKLLRLKDWLTVPDAARHLSILFGDDVSEADVLRLALDGRLTLSVRLVNRVTARPGKIIPPADAKIVVVEDVFGNTYQRIEEGVDLGNDRMLTFSRDVSFIEGIWDLSMLGTERVIVEKRYQLLTSGPTVELTNWNGLLVNRPDGAWWQIVAHPSKDQSLKNLFKSPYGNPAHYYAPMVLPPDAVLVVRTSALQDLEALMSESEPAMERPVGRPEPDLDRPVGPRERTTLLLIIAALAELARIDVKKPSKAATSIESQTALLGARVAARTIENHLRLIPEALADKALGDASKD